MISRIAVLSSVAVTGLVAGTANAATATQAQIETAALLSPFTVLNNTAAGQQVLATNLSRSIAINNGSNAQQRAQARSDNAIITDYGQQFSEGLGTTLDSAYQAALAANGPAFATAGPIVQTFRSFTGVSGGDSAFNKIFLANGTSTNNLADPVTNIALPAGGQFNVYDAAYGVNKTDPGQNPNGNSRPFQVAPGQIDPFAADITAGLTSNSAIPSGHTTFGTTEALLEAIAVPERFQQALARGLEYGYSRVVLGAHYTLDVLAGRILAIHDVANLLNNNPAYTGGADFAGQFASFTTSFRSVLTTAAGTNIATAAKADTGRFSDAAATAAAAEYRETYDLGAVGPTNLAAVVPIGSQVLLSTRFTYLSADQRRDVLATTELASGGPLDDGSGWARLDLYKAGGGYGAFNNQVTVNQDAALGGFSAADTFSNDIGGVGGLTHTGTGSLTLTGDNSYSGGTVVDGGTLVAATATALGTGDVAVNSGVLSVTAPALTVGGTFVLGSGGTLQLFELGNSGALVSIAGRATLGGTLDLDLGGFGDATGRYTLLSANGLGGRFDTVDIAGIGSGYRALVNYSGGDAYVKIAAVPEPASWGLMIAGFVMVGGTARRRRAVVGA